MEKSKPSIVRIIQSDYIALLGILFPLVSLIMYIAVAYFGFFPGFRGRDPIQGTEGAPLFFNLFVIGLVVGIPALVWRFRTIQKVFINGAEVTGKIESISFFRDRGNVVYSYQYDGKPYSGGNAIMKTARTKALSPGMEVILIVDKSNPKRALIRDLYT